MMKFFIEIIRERAISPYTNMIATAFLALGMGMAMAQNLSLSPDNRDVTIEAGSTDFTVTTNIDAGDLTVTADWTQATDDAAWSARQNHASVVFDNKMWVIGGSEGVNKNDVWSSTDGITWTQVTANAGWSARWDHTSVVFGDKMWVIGGSAGSRQNDVWSSTDGITWTQVTDEAAWSERFGHTSVVFDGRIWVMGGNESSIPPRLNDVWSSTDGITWTQATSAAAWSGRDEHTSVVYDNMMWVMGGWNADGSARLRDVWSSTDGITWSQATANAAWSGARNNHTSVVYDNKMWVIGGSPNHDNAWHSTDGTTWTEATDDAPWSRRWSHTSVVFDGKMWVIGGWNGAVLLDDVYFSYGDWLDASLSGTTLTATYEANGIADPRTGTVTISGSGLTATATVTQAEPAPSLGLSPTNQDVTAETGSTDFTVATNIPESDLTVTTVTADTWTEATNAAAWSAREEHTSVVFDNKMWVIGGYDGTFRNDVWNSTDGVTWTEVMRSGTGWSARNDHTSVVFDNKIWVIGGYDGSDLNGLDDVWSSTDGATWTRATDNANWSARRQHTSVVFDNNMWVIGGYDGSDKNDVWSSTNGITWTEATDDAAWPARDAHTSVVFDNKMWVIGGLDADDSRLADVWNSTDGITWTQVTTTGTTWSARYFHASVVFDNRMWVIGGSAVSGNRADVWHSTDGAAWTEATADAAWSARHIHTSVVFDNKMWVIGGNDGSDKNDVYFSEEWLTASLSGSTLTADYEANGIINVPRTGTVTLSGRGLTATATVTQAGAVPELAVSPANQNVTAAAGSTDFTVTINVPESDLTVTADTWAEATNAAGWSARNAHASVVFDNKMWVIGGWTGSNDDDVWHSTDGVTWTEVMRSGTAWSARHNHASVVFDNKMWVIGGYDGDEINDVWHSTDGATWTEATDDAPWSARENHTSVVFDNRMWVIGGLDNGGRDRVNDVWHSTDGVTWTQATANAAWSARSWHTSVVFDNRMWVIGGDDGSRQDDVWSSTDGVTWTQATANAAWSGRISHASVVFDNKMWVVGGFFAGSGQNDVWHSTDGATWTEATADAAWSARDDHTSVAFDNKMWVIGGTDGSRQNDVYFSAGDWLAASLSGTTLTADYEANGIFAPRTGTVTVSGEGLTRTVTVTQAGAAPELALSPANRDVSAEIGSTTFTVNTNLSSGDLTTTDDADWLTVSLSGTTLTADYEVNSMAAPRTGTVTVSGEGLTEMVTVTQAGAVPELALSPANQDVTAESGSTTFTVTTNVPSGDLTITDDAEWLTVTLSGTTLTADYETNGIVAVPRTGTITVSGLGLTQRVTVTQAGIPTELALSPATQSVTAETGSTNFTVTTNLSSDALTITGDADWLTVSLSGTTLTADYEVNSMAAPRTGTVTVSGGGLTEMVTVTQAGAVPQLALSPANQDVTAESGSTTFTVTTNVPSGDLTITGDADWLTVTLSGTTLTADYEANGIVAVPRTGTITVSGLALTQRVTVTQAGIPIELALSPANQDVSAETGSMDFMVTTNLPSGDLTITDDADWLTVSLSGTTLTANYEANSITAPRTGTVTVSGGGRAQTVTVTQAGAVPELALSSTRRIVTAEAGNTDFTVTTNLPSDALTITDDADWLTVSLSGTTLTANYEANSITAPRTGMVTVSGGGLTETVTVVQEALVHELALSPATQSVTAEAGRTDFTVTTNVPSGNLTITDDADWLAVSLSGTTLTAAYLANGSTSPRTGTITVSGEGLTETVTVVQAEEGVTFELALSPAMQSVTAEAGSTDFTVTTNLPSDALTITDDADWLTVSLSGTTLTADYEANSDTGPRTGTMTVSGGGLTETVTVTQAGAALNLALSPATQNVTAEAGTTDFTVTTNVPSGDLTITDDADWLTVSLSGTSSPYTLTADYEANSDTSPRTGTVTVSGGGLTETVTVTQAQAGVVFELSLSPATQSVTNETGSTNFTVTTNLSADALTITDDADWLTVSLSGTSSPYTLTATYEANSITSPRTGIVTVSGGGLTEMVTVVQAETGVTFELALSPATQSVTGEAGSTDFMVTTNLPSDALTITDDVDWLTVSLSGTSSPYMLTAEYEANSSTSSRTGTVTVSGGGLTETVTVTQAQAGVVFELSLSPAVQSVTNEAGTTDFTVTTNLSADALTTTDDADWMTTELSGTTLTATYEANESTDPRTGTVTVSGGGLTETVTVEQEGTPLGLEDETALVVYPNPGGAQVTVDFGDMAQGEGKEWMLFDPSGRKALSGSVARGETTLVINTQGLLSGLYLFQVRVAGHTVSHRVVILH